MRYQQSTVSLRSCMTLCLLLAVFDAVGWSQDRSMRFEDRFIRQTYLKLSFLNEAALRRETTRSQDARSRAGGALSFALKNFRTGPIEEILERPVAELATLPSGEIIRVAAYSVRDTPGSEETISYQAHWATGSYSTSIDPVSFTVRDALRQMGPDYADIGKYTAYDVTASLQGKERSYHALLLFHSPFGSSTSARADFWDSIVGMGGVLSDVAEEVRPPLGSRQRVLPDGPDSADRSVKDKPHGVNGSDAEAPLSATLDFCDGSSPICCPDSATGLDQCCWDPGYLWGNPGWFSDCRRVDGGGGDGGGGGGGGDEGGGGDSGDPSEPACAYSFSTGTPVNLFSDGSLGHAEGYETECRFVGGVLFCNSVLVPAGQHSASTNLHGECVTDTRCNKRCNVVIDSYEVAEWGHTQLFYHVKKEKGTESNDATGHSSATLSCAGGYGYAVDQCLTPWCAVSLVVSGSVNPGGIGMGAGVSVQSSAMWSAAHGTTHQCQPQ